MRRIVDISVPLKAGIVSDHRADPEIEFRDHADTAGEVLSFFPGCRARRPARPRGLGRRARPAHRRTTAPTSTRPSTTPPPWTAASAPSRSTRSRWSGACSPAVKLDFRQLRRRLRGDRRRMSRPSSSASAMSCSRWRSSSSTPRAGAQYGQHDYVRAGCGMGREATLYLLERGVRVTGTDAWSWDAPFVHTGEALRARRRRLDDLGGPQGRTRDRLLPHREAAQPRGAAARRLRGRLLPGEGARRLGGVDARGGDPAVSENQKRLPSSGPASSPSSPPWRSISLLEIASPRP